MGDNYKNIDIVALPENTGFCYPSQKLPVVTKEQSAITVMTDLCKVSSITVLPEASVDVANHRMIQKGISLLFVVDLQCCVIGLITARDILGKKTQQFLQETQLTPSEMCVIDIMTPLEDIEALTMKGVEKACVGDILCTLNNINRRHMLVIEEDNEGYRIRGIFSRTQIEKQLDE